MHFPSRPRPRGRKILPALALLLAAGCSPGGGGRADAGEDDRPRISVEPLAGPPGTDVQVRVSGFPPDVVVDVGFGPPRSEYEVIARTQTDGAGGTAAAVRIPARAAPGRPYVFVATYPPTLLRLTSDTFRVTAPGAVPAADTATAGRPGAAGETEVRITGRLTDEGVECPALRGDDGRLYTLAGSTGGFRAGDRVTVAGTVAEMSTCMQGTTIEVGSIERTG